MRRSLPAQQKSAYDRPWGYKLTFSVYFEGHSDGFLDDLHMKRVIRAVSDEVQDAHFVGAKAEAVFDEPNDQVAT